MSPLCCEHVWTFPHAHGTYEASSPAHAHGTFEASSRGDVLAFPCVRQGYEVWCTCALWFDMCTPGMCPHLECPEGGTHMWSLHMHTGLRALHSSDRQACPSLEWSVLSALYMCKRCTCRAMPLACQPCGMSPDAGRTTLVTPLMSAKVGEFTL